MEEKLVGVILRPVNVNTGATVAQVTMAVMTLSCEPCDGCVYTQDDGNPCSTGPQGDAACDNADTCSSGVCLTNYKPSGTKCGDGTDTVCDNADTWNATGQCANDNNEPTSTRCRAAGPNGCDVAEYYDGAIVMLLVSDVLSPTA